MEKMLKSGIETPSTEQNESLKEMLKCMKEMVASMVPNPNRIYTQQDLCKLLDVTPKLLARYRNDGLLAYHQTEGKIWYCQEDVDEFMKRIKVPAYAY